MAGQDQEIEVKFFLHNLAELEKKLLANNASLVQPRLHEINLRYDTPDQSLSRSQQVLRLRKDRENFVTYKDPGSFDNGVRTRKEIEYKVDDFGAAQRLFEALGYTVLMMYEKYRAVYRLEDVLVTLDEMPFGWFAEIEGPSAARIQQIANQLDLDWEKGIQISYTAIFDRIRTVLRLPFRDLNFENFATTNADLRLIGIQTADWSESI